MIVVVETPASDGFCSLRVAPKEDAQGLAASREQSTFQRPNTPPKIKRHKRFYMSEGNIIIQVENTLFRISLSVLHENSPILRSTIPSIQSGSSSLVGFSDKRPLILREIAKVDFARLLSTLFPSQAQSPKKSETISELLSVLKLATSFQMERVRAVAMRELHQLPIDPIRKIAIWEEFHLDPDLLFPSFAELCQRSEPLTLPMTMSLGIRNFTKVAASRDYYRQRVGCIECRRTMLSVEESQKIAEEIVGLVFAKRPTANERPLL